MDESGSTNVDAGQVSDTGRERGRYGLSNWNSGGGSGVTGASRGMSGMSLVDKRIQARKNGGSALGRSISTPHAPSQFTLASASTYSAKWRSDEKPSNDLTATATKPRYVGPRPVMITLPSSPSPQNSPDPARGRGSSLSSASPTANGPRLKSPEAATSPIEHQSATATHALDLGSEADSDEHSLTSELSDLSDDPDFQRRVEERGQKRVLLRELTAREESGDGLNEDEQALLNELRRAQEIETAAWSGGAHGLFEVEKIETTQWERYKERLRTEAAAIAEEHPEDDYKGGQYDEDGQEGPDPPNLEGSESEVERERLRYEGQSSRKMKHRDSLNLHRRSASFSADAYSRPSNNVSSSAHKPRPVSSASQYHGTPASTSNHMGDHDDGVEMDHGRERGRFGIKNEEEEEEYYQRIVAGPSTARPTSRNGVSTRDTGSSQGMSVGGTLAAGLVAKARDRRLGKPAGGSGEYLSSDLDDKRERVLRLQREQSMREREARRAKTVATASMAGGSGISPTGHSNPAIPMRTPHARKQSQTGVATAGRGTAPATAEAIAVAERAQLAGSTGRTLRGNGMKRARSPSNEPREGMVEKVPATKYGGALPPSNPRTQPRSRRGQQQNSHGVYAHDFARQQHQSHFLYQQPAYSQPIYPTADPNVAAQPQYAPKGTLLSRSATAPAPVGVDGHAQNLLPQVAQVMNPNTPGNSSTGSTGEHLNGTTVVVGKRSYTKLDLLGKGGSSRVYRVMRTTDKTFWALKRVTLDKSDHDTMKGYMNEIQLLKRLDGNPNIIQLIEHDLRHAQQSNDGTLLMVMELGEIDFSRLLQERAGLPISPPWIIVYWKQMLEAVGVIHDEKIVHSDLKPANFVLVKGRLKLIDFGIANAIANDTTNIQRDNQIGTVNYMSPEAIEAPVGMSRLKIGRASDVWSLGCIFYQMVYGAPPFQAYNMHQKMRIIPDGSWKIQYPDVSVPIIPAHKTESGEPEKDDGKSVPVPPCFIATMQRCLERDPKKRGTIPELLAEEWVNTVPIAQALRRNLVLKEDEAIVNNHYLVQLLHYFAELYHKRRVPSSIPFQDDDKYRALLEEAANDIIPALKGMTDPEKHPEA